MLRFKAALSLSSWLFRSSSLSLIRMGLSAYLTLLLFLPAILTPAYDLSSLAFHMIYSACKLNHQGDIIQVCLTPFSILNQSTVPCKVLLLFDLNTGFSGTGKVSGIPIFLRILHRLLLSMQSKALA